MKRKAFAQIPIMLGLLLMAVAVPVATKLVQQSQENRGRATSVGCWDCTTGCCDNPTSYGGDGCRACSVATTAPKTTTKPKATESPTTKPCEEYCSSLCTYGCDALSCTGGHCKSAPTVTKKPTATATPGMNCASGSTCKYGVSDCGAAGYENGSGTCAGGKCCGAEKSFVCSAGEKKCVGLILQTCNATRTGWINVTCSNGCIKDNGVYTCKPDPTATPITSNTCSSKGGRCLSGTSLATATCSGGSIVQTSDCSKFTYQGQSIGGCCVTSLSLPNGSICTANANCTSGRCSTTGDGLRCTPLDIGVRCDDDNDCASSHCYMSFCVENLPGILLSCTAAELNKYKCQNGYSIKCTQTNVSGYNWEVQGTYCSAGCDSTTGKCSGSSTVTTCVAAGEGKCGSNGGCPSGQRCVRQLSDGKLVCNPDMGCSTTCSSIGSTCCQGAPAYCLNDLSCVDTKCVKSSPTATPTSLPGVKCCKNNNVYYWKSTSLDCSPGIDASLGMCDQNQVGLQCCLNNGVYYWKEASVSCSPGTKITDTSKCDSTQVGCSYKGNFTCGGSCPSGQRCSLNSDDTSCRCIDIIANVTPSPTGAPIIAPVTPRPTSGNTCDSNKYQGTHEGDLWMHFDDEYTAKCICGGSAGSGYRYVCESSFWACGSGTSSSSSCQSCVEACPNSSQPNLLQNCSPADSDGTSKDTLCNTAGITGTCGGNTYCCPTAGGAWTTDMSKCKGNCDNITGKTWSLNDFSIWRSEYIEGSFGTTSKTTWSADFDCDGKVTLNDFSIWRTNFIKSL